eukprot:CAMPEP_0179366618 /NCGR_PEP_ID=MMETSP0797-20121207/83156_1 /TAXON_ID=47934 /ORGANISM="Dinophysis acuminata, Strain DAEP01" /LENGTH=385 /DNA_ID=CAMNT_0021082151 /DNA_START=109 /DNA_END=1264 /DNA_ORIENTATION=-
MTTKPIAKGDAIELNLDGMTVEQGLDLIETERVQPLLKYLKTGIFENKTNMTFMKAYSVVVQFGDQQQPSHKLYLYYKKVIVEYCEENVSLILDCSGEDFLRKLADFWEKHTMLVYWMQRVFQYLDRFFTKNSSDYPDLFLLALRSFEETVYKVLKDRCAASLIDAVNQERDGREIDQDVVRHIVEMLYTVGCEKRAGCPEPRIQRHEDHPAWQSSSTGVYKTDFEPVLLAATAEYYRAWSRAGSPSAPAPASSGGQQAPGQRGAAAGPVPPQVLGAGAAGRGAAGGDPQHGEAARGDGHRLPGHVPEPQVRRTHAHVQALPARAVDAPAHHGRDAALHRGEVREDRRGPADDREAGALRQGGPGAQGRARRDGGEVLRQRLRVP